MIVATYTSEKYDPEKITGRFVKYAPYGDLAPFAWCETMVGKFGWRWDYRQGRCDEVAAAARERRGTYPPYVDWPLDHG